MKVQKEIRGTALLLLNLGAIWEWEIFALSRSFDSRERATLNIVQEAGWAPGPYRWVWRRKKTLSKSSFELRTFQPVTNHYTPTISYSAVTFNCPYITSGSKVVLSHVKRFHFINKFPSFRELLFSQIPPQELPPTLLNSVYSTDRISLTYVTESLHTHPHLTKCYYVDHIQK
jgi:hypothetical protein